MHAKATLAAISDTRSGLTRLVYHLLAAAATRLPGEKAGRKEVSRESDVDEPACGRVGGQHIETTQDERVGDRLNSLVESTNRSGFRR